MLPDAEIAELCRQLGAADFDVRERACRQLVAGGKSVVEKVVVAAESESLEVVARSVGVLKALYVGPDAQAREAALAALQKLSESSNRSVARRAAVVLNPPEPVVQALGRRGGGGASS